MLEVEAGPDFAGIKVRLQCEHADGTGSKFEMTAPTYLEARKAAIAEGWRFIPVGKVLGPCCPAPKVTSMVKTAGG